MIRTDNSIIKLPSQLNTVTVALFGNFLLLIIKEVFQVQNGYYD